MQTTLVDKLWGQEEWLVNDTYCVKLMTLKPGYQCSLHYHNNKDETFYVLSGIVMLNVGGVMHRMLPGDYIRIKPGMIHRFHAANGEPATFLESSTHHDDEDVVRLEDSRKI
jgi:mannose-6-phosphate isomerase-like protein (cupin superfamily)